MIFSGIPHFCMITHLYLFLLLFCCQPVLFLTVCQLRILSITILPSICPTMKTNIIPLELFHSFKFPFFGIFTISPFFQSYGVVSWLHTLLCSLRTFLVENSSNANSKIQFNSASVNHAFPFFKFVIAILLLFPLSILRIQILLPLQILWD